jgi:hypothetical protein
MKVITAFAALAIVAWGAAGASVAADPPAPPHAYASGGQHPGATFPDPGCDTHQ